MLQVLQGCKWCNHWFWTRDANGQFTHHHWLWKHWNRSKNWCWWKCRVLPTTVLRLTVGDTECMKASGVDYELLSRSSSHLKNIVRRQQWMISSKKSPLWGFVCCDLFLMKHSKLRHPNIVLMLGVCLQDTKQSIVFEFMDGGNVFDILHRGNRTLSAAEKHRILLQTARGFDSYSFKVNFPLQNGVLAWFPSTHYS